MRRALPIAIVLAAAAACGDAGRDADQASVVIVVMLDGQPVAGARVVQGGTSGMGGAVGITDGDGRTSMPIDHSVEGELVFMASVPSARIEGVAWTPGATELAIDLTAIGPDNPAYAFQDPGDPGRRDTTSQCGHCHVTMNDAWYASPHRTAASNPVVQDLYRGTADGLRTQVACGAAGGHWVPGSTIKGEPSPSRCELGAGVIPSLNADPSHATIFGGCADCHAPGIDQGAAPALGGRDLRDASGTALDYGVHCDVCHRVEAIDLSPGTPAGIAGRLRLHRPSEPSPSLALGRWKPLTFGPDRDVPNPRMGLVARDHFHEATLCAGCHELMQAVLAPGATIDRTRWPDGTLPVQTTFSEWRASPLGPRDADGEPVSEVGSDPAAAGGAPCQGCHMPPAPSVWNAADLQLFMDNGPGVAAGWMRPPGAVRAHSFLGPRQRESRMLELAARLTIDKELSDREVVARVTVQNVGPGHALPTGDPLRTVMVLVEARCDDTPSATTLDAIGGDVLPDYAGAIATRAAGDAWTRWPEAHVGDVVRVVARPGSFYDYNGFGPFAKAGAGAFDAAAKGLPVESAVGTSTVIALADDGTATFDRPLPDGDVAYLAHPSGLPADRSPAAAMAGAPGFAFARVMVGADGRRMVPHFLAVDVASDNRLLPRDAWTSTHRFARPPGCTAPRVRAVLVHRAWPFALAAERGWPLVDSLMAEATR
ncbi:MAG: hypothetical protein U1F43_08325 [Myxococcota bacterium]